MVLTSNYHLLPVNYYCLMCLFFNANNCGLVVVVYSVSHIININTMLHFLAPSSAISSRLLYSACLQEAPPTPPKKRQSHADVNYWTRRVQQRTHLLSRASAEYLGSQKPSRCAHAHFSKRDRKSTNEGLVIGRGVLRTTYPRWRKSRKGPAPLTFQRLLNLRAKWLRRSTCVLKWRKSRGTVWRLRAKRRRRRRNTSTRRARRRR